MPKARPAAGSRISFAAVARRAMSVSSGNPVELNLGSEGSVRANIPESRFQGYLATREAIERPRLPCRLLLCLKVAPTAVSQLEAGGSAATPVTFSLTTLVGVLYGDIVKAVRLVVDTGIHAKGWTREHAIEFGLNRCADHTHGGDGESRALFGQPRPSDGLQARPTDDLRLKAKAALGDRFDPRAFHTAVLNSSALPLPILKRKIDAWIAAHP